MKKELTTFRKNEIIEMDIDCQKVVDRIIKQIEFHEKQSNNDELNYQEKNMNRYMATYLKENILNIKTK